MANPFSRFIYDKFIAPVEAERFPAVAKDATAFAYGVGATQAKTLAQAIGQTPDVNYALLYAVATLNADVAACVERWAGGVTGNGWHLGLMDKAAEPTRKQRKELAELTRWLRNPHPSKRFSLILYELIEHLAIAGDAYLEKVKDPQGRILELRGVHPITMRIEADEYGVVTGYVQQIGHHKETFLPDQISHIRLPNAHNDLYGRSRMISALEEIGLDLQAVRSNRAIFENGLKPSAILLMEAMGEEQLRRAATLIRERYTGASHTHSLMALGGVKDVKPWGQTLKDMEFSELRALGTEKVANAYGVPKLFLNQKDAADYSTSDVVERMFYTTTIRPVQDLVEEVITEEIVHAFNDEYAFSFNEPDFANADTLRRDALQAEHQGIMTDDEVRERYFSLPKKTPEQRAEEEAARQAVAAQMQPKDALATPQADQGEADTQAGSEAENAPAKKRVSKALAHDDIEAIRARREGIHDQLEAAIMPHVVAYFERQESRYLDRLASTFKSYHAHKQAEVEKAVLDSLIAPYFDSADDDDRELSIQLFADLETSLAAGVAEAGLQIAFTFDSEASQAIIDEYLLKNALAHAKIINGTTKDQLREALREGIAAGEGVPELRARVKSVFTQASTNRADTIARTETSQAFEYANERAMIESGVVREARWATSLDDRVRPAHSALEGVVVPLGEAWPGGIKPGQEFRCRCTAIGIVDEDA
jgi:HK97 family phage portal protein